MKLPATPTINSESEAYFAWARGALHTHRFRRGERELWALHADGCSYADMSQRTGIAKTVLFSLVKQTRHAIRKRDKTDKVDNVNPGVSTWRRNQAVVSRALDEMLELLVGTSRTKRRSY